MSRPQRVYDDFLDNVLGEDLDAEQDLPYRHPRRHWSPSAVYCFASKKDCAHCFNHRFYGLKADDNCHMPLAVKELLSHGVQIPKALMDRLPMLRISGRMET